MATLQPITCMHDGTRLQGVAAIPKGQGPFPAVLVMHSAVGINDFFRGKVQTLAEQGYCAVATDMYGGNVDLASEDAFMSAYTNMIAEPVKLRARVVAWFETVAARPDVDASRIAAIGYCFGGKCALELARSGADAKVAVSFHGILTTHEPAHESQVKGHVAAWCGDDDPFAPQADIAALRQELEDAGASYAVTAFGGVAHGFTDPASDSRGRPGIKYDAIADKTSWAGTLALLEEVLKP